VHTRVAVRRVVPATDAVHPRVVGLELDDGRRVDADAVVLAVPHPAAAALLPNGAIAERDRLIGLGRSPIVDVHIVFDRRVTDLSFAAGLGTPAQWVFDRTESTGLASGQCLAVSLSSADHCIGTPPRELADTIVGALRSLFPQARDAKVLDHVV